MRRKPRIRLAWSQQLGRPTYPFSAAQPPAARGSRYGVLPSPEDFYVATVAELRESRNGWAWGLCPFHGDRSPSLCVNLESGYYKCHATHCGETGSSIVSFVSALHGLSYRDAIRWLKERRWT